MKLNKLIAERKGKKIYLDGDKIIKLFDEDVPKSNVLNEALNLARVEETGLNVPKIHEVGVIDSKWAIVMDYIEGKTLKEMMKKSPKKFDEYMDTFVDVQLEIQSKRAPLLNKLKDKMQGKISQSGLDATTRYDLHTRLDGMPKHIKVLHGDYTPGNVVITKDGTPYILDWAHATQGNASADAARTYLIFSLRSEKELGIKGAADKYMKTFCEKSDTAMQYVQRWLPIVASSQLVKNNPEERDFLLNWINVVDYE